MVVVKFPSGQRAVAGNAALDFDDTSGTEIRPGEFFLTGPHHFDGAASSACQTSSLDRSVTGVLPAVRRASVRHNHAHTAFRQMENRCKLIAVGEWPLRAGPHSEFSLVPPRYGRARLERSMSDVRNGIRRVEPMRCAGQPFFHGTLLLSEAVLGFGGGVLLQVGKKFLIGDLRNLFPFRFHGVERFLCFAFRGRCRSDKVPVPYDKNSRRRLCFALTKGNQSGPEGGRAQHFAVQHARKPDIGGIPMLPNHKRSAVHLWNWFPGDGPLRRRSDGIFSGEVLRKGLAAGEFRVRKRAARCGISDFCIGGHQSHWRDVPLLGRSLHENVPGRGGDAPQLWRHGRSRSAAKSSRVKRSQGSVRHHHANAFQRHAQFVSNGLRQLRANVLPNFRLAGESRYAAVFADVQPRANVLWQFFVVKTPVTRRCLLRARSIFGNREYGNSRAKNFEKVAARQIELMDRSGSEFIALRLDEQFPFDVTHRPRSCIIFAAWRTASMTRGCVPHRQTFPCKNLTTSA